MFDVKRITVSSKVMAEEREVIINIFCENGEWISSLYTCVEKYAKKCKKQGWKQISETRHKDGTFVSATFTASAKAISIRNAKPTKRVLSEEHKNKLLAARKKQINN